MEVVDFEPPTTGSLMLRSIFTHQNFVMSTDVWRNAQVTNRFYTIDIYRDLRGVEPKGPWRHVLYSNLARPELNLSLGCASKKDYPLKIILNILALRQTDFVSFASNKNPWIIFLADVITQEVLCNRFIPAATYIIDKLLRIVKSKIVAQVAHGKGYIAKFLSWPSLN